MTDKLLALIITLLLFDGCSPTGVNVIYEERPKTKTVNWLKAIKGGSFSDAQGYQNIILETETEIYRFIIDKDSTGKSNLWVETREF